jgi:outer membrane protein TolC
MASAKELNLDAVVQEVLTRNPSLVEMTAAWQAASARYPQVTSLDDPMFAATFGPETIHPDDPGVEFASRLEVSQKLPWPGKRRLRGENALAEASAAANTIDDMRLQLIESAKDAFYEYYLVGRALAVNGETLERLRQFRSAAQALYRTPPKEKKVSFQDVYQTDVEIGRTQERQVTLERMGRVAVARMNTLMHRAPDLPLPPPPKEVDDALSLPEPQTLRAEALSRRPDLQALANHIAAEQASLDLAYKEFYPDLEPFFMYDRFMGNTSASRDLATMLGVKLNLPVWQGRRHGAVAEAEARIAQRRAEFDALSDRINFQVQDAYERVRESERVLKLYKDRILPDIELNVKTAQADYKPGLVPAVSVIQAERDRLTLYDRYYEAIAEYHRRLATLERAIGGALDGAPRPQTNRPSDPVGVEECSPGQRPGYPWAQSQKP